MLNKTVPGSGIPSSLASLGLSVALSQAPDSSSEGPFLPDRLPPAASPSEQQALGAQLPDQFSEVVYAFTGLSN